MEITKTWLSDVTVVNESNGYDQVGDIAIFRSLGDACRKIEPWYVTDVSFFALNGEGYAIEFFLENGLVRAKINRGKMQDISALKNWLNDSVESILSVRQYKADKKKLVLGEQESNGILPTSVEGLIAYHSFRK